MKSLRILAGTGERRLEYVILEPDLLTMMLDELDRLRDFEAEIQELAIHEDDEWHAAELLDQIRKVVGNDD